MADRKITNHTPITGPNIDPVNDPIEIVDVTDTTDAPSGTNKRIAPKELLSRAWAYFRNVANTVDSFFTNTNTAPRTYSFMDRDGTMADVFNQYSKGVGRIIIQQESGGNLGTIAGTVNSLRAMPIRVACKITLDQLVFEITTGSTGNVRVGIYADTGNGYPGNLIIDSGNVNITAINDYHTSVNITLLPGIYWLTYITDTANTFRGISAGNSYALLGNPTNIGSVTGILYAAALTFGALPSTYPAGAVVGNSAVFPVIGMRLV